MQTKLIEQTKPKKVKVLKGLTSPQIHRLSELAGIVRDAHDAHHKLVKTVRDRQREALNEALQCGKALNEAKEICGHGKWMTWLGERCKGVNIKTAQRYMRVAANSTDLSNLDGL